MLFLYVDSKNFSEKFDVAEGTQRLTETLFNPPLSMLLHLVCAKIITGVILSRQCHLATHQPFRKISHVFFMFLSKYFLTFSRCFTEKDRQKVVRRIMIRWHIRAQHFKWMNEGQILPRGEDKNLHLQTKARTRGLALKLRLFIAPSLFLHRSRDFIYL